jgi:hypothetical protein
VQAPFHTRLEGEEEEENELTRVFIGEVKKIKRKELTEDEEEEKDVEKERKMKLDRIARSNTVSQIFTVEVSETVMNTRNNASIFSRVSSVNIQHVLLEQ